MPEWRGKGETLEDAFENAAEKADDGEHKVTIYVQVHTNQPGEQGPNPIREYSVVLGGG
jgi:hypothetical protein